MLVMSKKKKPSEATNPNRKGKQWMVYLPPELDAAAKKYMSSGRHKLSKTAITITALQDLLRSVGQWPPPNPVEETTTDATDDPA